MTRDVAALHERLAILEQERDHWRKLARKHHIVAKQLLATLDELGQAATNVARSAQGEVA